MKVSYCITFRIIGWQWSTAELPVGCYVLFSRYAFNSFAKCSASSLERYGTLMVRAQKKLIPVISETFLNGMAFIACPFWGIGVMNSTSR